MVLTQNSDFIFGFEATMTNPNGDPDQENKPRMDYETSTVLVSDVRRKRDIRDFLKQKGYPIFVDTLADKKVPMDKMFETIRDQWLEDKEAFEKLFQQNEELLRAWNSLAESDGTNYKEIYLKLINDKEKVRKKKSMISDFNNLFLTDIIKKSLIDIRLFGSAMAIEGITRTYTGPVQVTWGYSLHPAELVKSNTITTIMNDDASNFGKKHKLYYALIAHYGTINKYSAKLTGMTETDRQLFRKSLVQGMMSNQTDSKQGQTPLFYLEVIYQPEFDGYLGDLRRFLTVTYDEQKSIRGLHDLQVDFTQLSKTIEEMKKKDYIDMVVGWVHPFADMNHIKNLPKYEMVDLWAPINNG
ncbi:type I CRISPR-associated protein Cas7 [Microaerobacter geothermalis]|uniref:CRISPR-associated protein n=1 Tax=Microaerobacter geothermalis TaxID=674972 RepID=UPI001F27034E|nr:CRISPR-associated protein [Microaerobacter geothermalis]MCF6094007.1 type I CRISPR-associated protein Cas7 [Microaerobacter geothermalis]